MHAGVGMVAGGKGVCVLNGLGVSEVGRPLLGDKGERGVQQPCWRWRPERKRHFPPACYFVIQKV